MKRANLQFYITDPLSAAGSSVAISNSIGTDEEVELTDETSMTISYETRKVVERIKGTATGGTLTITERGLTDGETPTEEATLKFPWRPGAIVTVTLHPDDVIERDADETIPADWTYTGDVVYSGSVRRPVYADDAARDAAITAPTNGMMIYNTADGVNQQYIWGAWLDVDTGVVTPNASPTVAGKAENSTTAQGTAGDSTWETGALLFMTPAQIAAQIQSGSWLYWADAGGDDAYVVVLTPVLTAYATGQMFVFKTTTANTGACTVDFWPGAKNIKTKDGNDPQSGAIRASWFNIVVYDGTNMVLVQEDFASTGNKGISEKSTVAEWVARADGDRYVTPEILGEITKRIPLQTTRTSDAANGAVTIAHWLSQTPRWCMAFGGINQWSSSTITPTFSIGASDWTNNMCFYIGTTDDGASTGSTWGNDNNSAIRLTVGNSSGERTQEAVITFDSANVTLTWTKTSSNTDPNVTFAITLFVHT